MDIQCLFYCTIQAPKEMNGLDMEYLFMPPLCCTTTSKYLEEFSGDGRKEEELGVDGGITSFFFLQQELFVSGVLFTKVWIWASIIFVKTKELFTDHRNVLFNKGCDFLKVSTLTFKAFYSLHRTSLQWYCCNVNICSLWYFIKTNSLTNILCNFPRWSMISYSLWKRVRKSSRLRPIFPAVSCPAFLQRNGLIHPRCKKPDSATRKFSLCKTLRTIDIYPKYRDGKRNSYYNTIFFLKTAAYKWGIRDYMAWPSHVMWLHWQEKTAHSHTLSPFYIERADGRSHNWRPKRGSEMQLLVNAAFIGNNLHHHFDIRKFDVLLLLTAKETYLWARLRSAPHWGETDRRLFSSSFSLCKKYLKYIFCFVMTKGEWVNNDFFFF